MNMPGQKWSNKELRFKDGSCKDKHMSDGMEIELKNIHDGSFISEETFDPEEKKII